MHSPLLAPLLALVSWTFVMWAWLYATRIRALSRHGIVYDPLQPNEAFAARLPASVRWKGDNYNNLMEQPPIFYAVTLVLSLTGASDGPTVCLAWAYVAVRVAHSLVHVLVNRVMIRFGLFALGSLVLFVMTVRATFQVLS